jgi:hypothetical protein
VSFSGAALRSYAMGLASQFQILLVVIMMGTTSKERSQQLTPTR